MTSTAWIALAVVLLAVLTFVLAVVVRGILQDHRERSGVPARIKGRKILVCTGTEAQRLPPLYVAGSVVQARRARKWPYVLSYVESVDTRMDSETEQEPEAET